MSISPLGSSSYSVGQPSITTAAGADADGMVALVASSSSDGYADVVQDSPDVMDITAQASRVTALMSQGKVKLAVPYTERGAAKKAGAVWDPVEKTWYALHGEQALISRWSAPAELTQLVGEDRSFGGNRLFVDLIPRSCWFTNVRSCVKGGDWDRLRKYVYMRADHHCECCQTATDSNNPMEAHERWSYDKDTKTQKLMRIIALCQQCHEATHMGLARIRKRGEIAKAHLMKVTGMSPQEVTEHITNAFKVWRERNQSEWSLDLGIITDSGLTLKRRVERADRKNIAKTQLQRVRTASSRLLSHADSIERLREKEGPMRKRKTKVIPKTTRPALKRRKKTTGS